MRKKNRTISCLTFLGSLALILSLSSTPCSADVKSSSGTINFDSNRDGVSDARLTSTGLAIGSNLSASSNLQVAGNALISETLSIGGSSGSSNLNINGTIGFSLATLSDNTTLGDTSYIIADASSGNITLSLPSANTVSGRTYLIKKITTPNIVVVRAASGNIDNVPALEMSTSRNTSENNHPYLGLISDGTQWRISSKSEGVDSPWTAADLTIKVWFDASDSSSLSFSAGNVSAWYDKSGNDNHAVQSSGSLQPTLVDNAVDFDGSNILQVTNDPFNGLQDFGVIAVYHVDVTDAWGNVLAGMNGDPSFGWQIRQRGTDFNNRTFSRYGVTNTDFSVALADVTTDFIGAYYRDSGNVSYLRHDGTANASVNDGGPLSYTTLSNRSSIGGRYSANDWGSVAGQLDGAIKEIIVFENTSLEKVQKLEGYLAWKWGLEAKLPGAHPYKLEKPFQ